MRRLPASKGTVVLQSDRLAAPWRSQSMPYFTTRMTSLASSSSRLVWPNTK